MIEINPAEAGFFLTTGRRFRFSDFRNSANLTTTRAVSEAQEPQTKQGKRGGFGDDCRGRTVNRHMGQTIESGIALNEQIPFCERHPVNEEGKYVRIT